MRNVAGISLLVAGGLGCVLPVIPGIPLLLAGVATLGPHHPIVRSGRGWLARRGWWRDSDAKDATPSSGGSGEPRPPTSGA